MRSRSLICRFIRSRRCWMVIIITSRMPTPISVTRARPNSVAARLCHELKSRLRTLFSPAASRQADGMVGAERMDNRFAPAPVWGASAPYGD